MLNYDEARRLFNYDPITGVITLALDRKKGKAGDTVGWVGLAGYQYVSHQGIQYRAHRLIWLWMTGTWPTTDVDHKDNCRSNNRWSNLRLATRSQNLVNQGPKWNNKSGLKGVTSRGNSHAVRYRNAAGKVVQLGSFSTAIEAARAYDSEVVKHHGFFAKTNKSLGLIP